MTDCACAAGDLYTDPLAQTVLDTAQTRELERAYLGDGGYRLMRHAAGAVYAGMRKLNLDRKTRIVVFAGSGNNGGDGYEIAALFAADGYRDVHVFAVLPQKPGIDANLARANCLAAGVPELTDPAALDGLAARGTVIVDAILGIGAARAGDSPSALKVRAAARLINEFRSSRGCLVLSVDVPSLLNADTGMPAAPECVRADRTYTVFTHKPGTLLGRARSYCGAAETAGGSLPGMADRLREIRAARDMKLTLIGYSDVKPLLPRRDACAHKGSAGRVLLAGGSAGMTGALVIAAAGAVRAGAGLVTAAPLSGETAVFNVFLPNVMTAGADALADPAARADAILVGPGLGRDERGARIFGECLAAGKPVVIDADALYHLAARGGLDHPAGAALTPHAGEAARLAGCSVAEVEGDMAGTALRLARKYRAVCVLKSAATVIAEPSGNVLVTATGCSGMASGGMGDLLAGIIAGLAAQGAGLLRAAAAGVLIHGEAGRAEARRGGNVGMCATDLLPRVRALVNGLTGDPAGE